ncbi:MAG: hypothetical protein WCK53_10525, partial [Methanomicrobiales archaeon]
MNRTGYYILILFIMAIVVSSGCIVPTKNQPAPIDSQSGGTNYLVPGTGSAPQQQSPVDTQNQGASSGGPTPAPIP